MPKRKASSLSDSETQNYQYTPTERNIFSPSPYKDRLLPLWRFRTPSLARESADDIWAVFLEYEKRDDFIGMDNARKFLQMGMTRAKRYSNWKGGRKYDTASGGGSAEDTRTRDGATATANKRRRKESDGKEEEEGLSKKGVKEEEESRTTRKRRKVKDKGEEVKGLSLREQKQMREKGEASEVFREVWNRAKTWEGYVRRKDDFLERQRRHKKGIA